MIVTVSSSSNRSSNSSSSMIFIVIVSTTIIIITTTTAAATIVFRFSIATPSSSPPVLYRHTIAAIAHGLHPDPTPLRRGLYHNLLDTIMSVEGSVAYDVLSPLAAARALEKADPGVSRFMPPVLLLHGTKDKSVPHAGSVLMHEALKHLGVGAVPAA